MGKGEKKWEKGETRHRRRASQATRQRVGAGGASRGGGVAKHAMLAVYTTYDRKGGRVRGKGGGQQGSGELYGYYITAKPSSGRRSVNWGPGRE